MGKHSFDIEHTLHDIMHYLPSQMTLKDFVHHNSLHAFQSMKFYEGIFRASKIFGFKVSLQLSEFRELYKKGRITESVIERIIIERKGEDNLEAWVKKVLYQEYDSSIPSRIGLLRANWKKQYRLDLDTLTHPLLYRILASYLDQGISVWEFPEQTDSFLGAIRSMEQNSAASFFRTAEARALLMKEGVRVEDLLKRIVGDESYYEQYLYDLCFSHRGWSGIVAVLTENPGALLLKRPITLQELCIFELLLEMDALHAELGSDWKPIASFTQDAPVDILAETSLTELDEVIKIWQDAFEWNYYDQVVTGIQGNLKRTRTVHEKTSFQAIFCIDERECSLRRHLELVAPDAITFGAPGFFGVEFYYLQQDTKFLDKLCPAPVTPKYLIKEMAAHVHHASDIMFSPSSHKLETNIFSTFYLGALALPKLLQGIFMPKMTPSISDAFSHMTKGSALTIENKAVTDREYDLQVGFTIEEMTVRVENFLRGIGLIANFADLIYVVAHGSSSGNNPHHGAHDCGACSGRPGATNARVFAGMANHPKVRQELALKGIILPATTVFVPAMHDTAADTIGYYDENGIPANQLHTHLEVKQAFEDALDLNAKERSRRFASISTKQPIKKIRKAIYDRSVELFEPRPELGHGTNSLCIVGRRELTRGLFLDRRAFLNSYDYRTDLEGKYLANVMAPIGVVCGGINLEYYFSRVDNVKLGCGTKLPHNVVGLIGVANSSDGDLRPGLPWQMIEPHDPVRLLVVVEHYPEVVLKVIQSNPAMYEWYKNEWVHIMALHPDTQEFFYYRNGHFLHYHAEALDAKAVASVHHLFEEAPEMMTNAITHATFENLPIYQIENNIQWKS
ncbi:MAG: hypothetical protein RL138_278 [Bacteroidota bacterium]